MTEHYIPKAKPEPIDNTELVTQFRASGGNILHLRPHVKGERGTTFAFVRQGSRITFSTAVQHRGDEFTKKKGTKVAIEHFLAGKTVTLPLPNEFCPVRQLKRFYNYFY